MKLILFFATLSLGLNSMAKVADFNALIDENSKAQSELHHNLKENLDLAKSTQAREVEEKFIVDRAESTITVPTSKKMLTFSKEKKYYRASEQQQQKRLAEEINQAE